MQSLRGSVLVQVLLAAVVVSIIAAGMMNLMLMRSTSVKRDQDRAAGTARTGGGLNAIIRGWVAAGGVTCSPVTGFTFNSGSAGNCNCTYTAMDGTGTTICAGAGCNPAAGTSPCELRVVGLPPP